MSDHFKNGPPLGEPQAVTPGQSEPRSTIPALVLFPTEERHLYDKLHKDMWGELAPDGVQQRIVTNRVIALSWRLQHLHVFRDAQDARKKYRPFLRDTLLETLAVYSRFETNITNAKFAFLQKEKSADEKKEGESPATLQSGEAEVKEDDKMVNPMSWFDLEALADCFQKFMEVTNNVLGSDEVKDIKEDARNGFSIELAFFADVLTVENYLNELELAAAIERMIDENLERLRKLKDEKRKSLELSKPRSRLLPPYD